jgi:hypothetical protein
LRITRTLAFVIVSLAMLVAAYLKNTAIAQEERAAPYGSGSFGRWVTDQWGLPAYDYTLDERVDPRARILEIDGDTAAWHQVGNDHVMANAYNYGYVQLWSQDRDYQWVNQFDAAKRQYGGGFGYLRVNGKMSTTLALDRSRRGVERRFGIGYFRHAGIYDGVVAEEYVYAPYGDDSYLYHDVILENPTSDAIEGTWWEYWGVNPGVQGRPRGSGLAYYAEGGDSSPSGQRPLRSGAAASECRSASDRGR